VLDVDPRNGGDLALEDLQHSYAPLAGTPMALSGSKEPHYYFALNSPLGKFDPGPGLNLQADGALIVAPPSLHHSGRCYEWEASSHPDDVALAPIPAWLRALGEAHTSAVMDGVDLPPTLPSVAIQTLKVSPRVKYLIAMGHDPDDATQYCHADGTLDRSRALFAVIQALLAAGHDDATIAGVIMDARYPISHKVLSQKNAGNPRYWEQTKGWVAKEIARAKAKHQPPASLHVGQQATGGTAQEPTRTEGPLPYSDYTNALAFVRDHGTNVRYCYPWKAWLVWTGTHWQRDTSGHVMRLAKQTIKRLARHVEDLDGPAALALLAHIKTSLAQGKLKAMVECAQSEPGIPIQPEDLDTHPWLLNCRNGTLDLCTGGLRPHARADLLTFVLPVDYDALAACPTWDTFLKRIMAGNTALINFLQRAVGYALTGVIREHVLLILWGTGRNGKSTFLNTLRTLLAAYAMKAPSELLMVSNNDRHPTERADLCGKRFVAAIETEQGRRLAEVFVKEATGGDPIRARRMREDFWEFQPTHKVFLATNHKPMIAGTDPAIWERIRLVPSTVTIPPDEIDTTLPEKLEAELPGILNWALRGCMTWQEQGLGIPDEVKAATAGYRSEMDVLGQFIDECCLVGPNYRVKASDLYDTYKQWCTEHGESFDVQRTWGMKLTDRGYESRKKQGRSWWVGIALPDRTPPQGKHNDEHDTTDEKQVDEDGGNGLPEQAVDNKGISGENTQQVDEGRRKNGINRTSNSHEGANAVSSSTSSTSSTSTDDDPPCEALTSEPPPGVAPVFTSFTASALWCGSCRTAQPVEEAHGVLSCTVCGVAAGAKTVIAPATNGHTQAGIAPISFAEPACLPANGTGFDLCPHCGARKLKRFKPGHFVCHKCGKNTFVSDDKGAYS
jgi:putative DNA primase/helicase